MNIDIQSRDFALSSGLRTTITARVVEFASTFRRGVRRLAVRVYDTNGTRGGPDKACTVVADLVDGRVVVSSEIDTDLYRAIPRAFAKLRHGTRIARQQKRARRREAAAAFVALAPAGTGRALL